MEVIHRSAENPVQLNDFCRLCLVQKPDLRPLSGQIQTMMIPEMLYKVTGALLNMYEQLPRVICERCLVKLELAYNIAEEFRKQEEQLRRLTWKGVLVDQLMEYQHSEESRRKPYSEEIIERLTVPKLVEVDTIPLEAVPEHQDETDLMDLDEEKGTGQEERAVPIEDQLHLVKPEPIDVPGFSIKLLPDEPIDEVDQESEWKQQPNDIINNELEMVLELEDLRTIGALPEELLKQLDMQQIAEDAPEEIPSGGYYFIPSSEDELSDDDKDTEYVPDGIVKDQEEEVFPEYSEPGYGDLNKYMENQHREYIPSLSEPDSEHHADEDMDYYGQSDVQDGQFRCEICNRYYETQKELDEHYSTRHKAGQKPYKHECKYCQQRYLRVSSLVAHEKGHENRIASGLPEPNQGPHKCSICNRRYHSMNRFNYHMRRHEYIKKGKFQCKVCNHSFGGLAELQRHERRHETKPEWQVAKDNVPPPILSKKDNKTLYKCGECHKAFVSSAGYFRHAQRHVIRKTGMFQCQLCGKCYGNKKPLRHHQRLVHNINIKSEPDEMETTIPTESAPQVEIEKKLPRCSMCDAFFLSQKDYKIHMGVHKTPANQKPSIEATDEDCQLLEDAIPTESPIVEPSTSVEMNESKALGSALKCDECGESMKSQKDRYLQDHKLKHERIRNLSQKCTVCKIAFPTSISLKRHCETDHGFVKRRDLSDAEECPLCNRPINILRRHIYNHETIHLRKYVCALCDSAFGSPYYLAKHEKAGLCQEPGFVPKTEKPLTTDNIRDFFKWINKRKTPNGAESLPMLEEQDGLFKCKQCGLTFEGFASAGFHTEKHQGKANRRDSSDLEFLG